jgi:hypothetical protein
MSGIVGDNTARASGVIAAAGGGKLLQVVNTVKTDASTISTSWADISGLSVAITPSATSSKIYISCSVMFYCGRLGFIKLLRDVGGAGFADSAYIGDSAGSRRQCISFTGQKYDWENTCVNIGYLDTTNTTSEVTYKLQGLSSHATYWLGINKRYPDSDSNSYGRGVSSITAYEVGA